MDFIINRFGCCPDGISTAIGPNWTGCFECIEGSGDCELCNETKYGCCPDGIGIAAGPNFAGCIEETTTMICLFLYLFFYFIIFCINRYLAKKIN